MFRKHNLPLFIPKITTTVWLLQVFFNEFETIEIPILQTTAYVKWLKHVGIRHLYKYSYKINEITRFFNENDLIHKSRRARNLDAKKN